MDSPFDGVGFIADLATTSGSNVQSHVNVIIGTSATHLYKSADEFANMCEEGGNGKSLTPCGVSGLLRRNLFLEVSDAGLLFCRSGLKCFLQVFDGLLVVGSAVFDGHARIVDVDLEANR